MFVVPVDEKLADALVPFASGEANAGFRNSRILPKFSHTVPIAMMPIPPIMKIDSTRFL